MNNRSILSVFGVLALVACSAGSAPGSGATTSNGATGAGAGSGTGAGNGPSSGGSSPNINVSDDGGPDSGDVMNGVCANQSFDLQRKPAEILIVLDRSASMADPPDGQPSGSPSKWSLVVPGVNEVVTSTDSAVSWGLKVFPEGEGSECVAGSVTSMIPVPIAPANAAAVTAAVTATTDAGNGTPTGDAIKAAVTYLKTLTDPNPKFILLATDGEPSCSGTSKDSTGARTYAVQAVTDAATAGFKTFVVGVATTKATATQALNDMAVAGQMARADSNPLATKFYLASTKDELVTSLQTITGQVASCTFDLTAKPPDPYNIAVHVNNDKAPNDMTKTNGWDYTGSDQMQIQVYGSWCDQIKAANANTVNFVFGCPGQPPPA
jgi:von Willebrand factor type A domain-containing protein